MALPEEDPAGAANTQVDVISWSDGTSVSTRSLDPQVFGVPVRRDVVHEVIRWQLAGRRAGNAKVSVGHTWDPASSWYTPQYPPPPLPLFRTLLICCGTYRWVHEAGALDTRIPVLVPKHLPGFWRGLMGPGAEWCA